METGRRRRQLERDRERERERERERTTHKHLLTATHTHTHTHTEVGRSRCISYRSSSVLEWWQVSTVVGSTCGWQQRENRLNGGAS